MARKHFTDEQRQERREEILDAAMQVFETEGGVAAVSFRNVAAVVGCSYSAPYTYFTGKEDLLNALRARAFRWIEGEMKAAIQGKRRATAKLDALARAYINAGIARPQRYALMFFDMENSDIAKASLELKAAKRDALNVCTQVIADGQASGELNDAIDALTAAHLFWTGAHGLVSLQVSGQFVMGRKVDEIVQPLLQSLSLQLAHAPAENTPAQAANS